MKASMPLGVVATALFLSLSAYGDEPVTGGEQTQTPVVSDGAQQTYSFAFSATRLRELDQKKVQQFSNAELAEYLSLRPQAVGDRGVTQEIAFFASKALGQPYRLNSMRFDLAESDCVVFIERVLAMSLAGDWPSYYRLRQRLSHKNGVVSALERNIFTEGDWIPNNSWLLEDITETLGPAKEFTCPIRRKSVISQRRFGLDNTTLGRAKAAEREAKLASLPDEEMYTGKYLPRETLPQVESKLQTGDICLFVRSSPKAKPYLFCDHLGILVRSSDDRVMLIHSTPPAVRRDELAGMFGYPTDAGFKIVRVKPSARQLVTNELNRCGTGIQVATPLDEDQKSDRFRRIRAGQ